MKSIVAEGSSIALAIEAAWKRAQQPTEFSVKVFHDAEKNFFGFTKKSAKISIFFDHAPEQLRREQPKKQPRRDVQKPADAKSAEAHPAAPVAQQKKFEAPVKNTPRPIVHKAPLQAHEVSDFQKNIGGLVGQWLKTSLDLMNLSHLETQLVYQAKSIIKVVLLSPLRDTVLKEHKALRALSHLATEHIRCQSIYPLKAPIRVIIVGESNSDADNDSSAY